jgi:hypothetical protein
MAVYKVIQDVEAEDKIVGFLTLKTFVYALIAAALGYINFRLVIASELGVARWFILLIFLFPMLLFALLSLPLGGEQPTEVWVLSRVRFFIKPRLRTWNQSGVLELVTITVPRKIERQLTKNLTQREVRSRLKALATTLDSRGWAVRNVAVNLSTNPSYLDIIEPESDRLAAGSNLPQSQGANDIHEADDIMDEQNNPTAQHFEALMQQEDARRKTQVSKIISNINQAQSGKDEEPEPAPDYGILDSVKLGEKDTTNFVNHAIVAPGSESTTDEAPEVKDPELAEAEKAYLERERKLSEEVHAKSVGFKPKPYKPSMPEIPPGQKQTDTQPQQKQKPKSKQEVMTKTSQNANLKELAQSGSAFSVATVQQLANRNTEIIKQISDNEVEIDLHGH